MKITVEDVAKMAHEVNRSYCQLLGDYSQPEWDGAPKWQQDSAIAGVQYHLGNPYAGPSGSHESWLSVKEKEGWKYGPIKDPDKKEHPCFVPYHQLPKEQKLKDSFFTMVVDILRDYVIDA